MATENITVTLGIDYFIEINVDRFTELLESNYVLSGQIREVESKVLKATFDIVKSPINNKIYSILTSDSTKTLTINNQIIYGYDILAKKDTTVYKLIDGSVNFQQSITTI